MKISTENDNLQETFAIIQFHLKPRIRLMHMAAL